MRIPFLAKVDDPAHLGVEPGQLRYIADTRGGSAFLLAGAVFWLVGAVFCLLAPGLRVEWVLYAGLSVPFVAMAISRLQGPDCWATPGTPLSPASPPSLS